MVSGTLKTNSSGVVIGATMEMLLRPQSANSSNIGPRIHQSELEYEYDTSISDVFPAVIKRFVVQPKRFLRDEIRLHRIKLSAQPMAKEAFAYEPFVNTNSWVLHGTNDGFFYIDRQGAKQPLLLGNPAEDGSRRVIIPILFIGAMLVIPVILFKLVKRK